jgi:hypothetical protein
MKLAAVLLLALVASLATAEEPTSSDYQGAIGALNSFSAFLDYMSQEYSDFSSPLSYSSGALGALNLTVTGNFFLPPPYQGSDLGILYPDLLNGLQSLVTQDVVYTDYGTRNYLPYVFTTSGISNIALVLFEALVAAKTYGLHQVYGSPNNVSRIAPDLIQVRWPYETTTLGTSPACLVTPTCYPTGVNDPNLIYYSGKSYQVATVRKKAGVYLVASITDVERYRFAQGTLIRSAISFVNLDEF